MQSIAVIIFFSALCSFAQALRLTRYNNQPYPAFSWIHRPDKGASPTYPLKVEVVSSAILGFAPWLELHHIVVLRDPICEDKGIYTIDFSPANYDDPKTLGKMLLGRDVQGEIRVRWIPNDKLSMDEIKNNCMSYSSEFFDDLQIDNLGKGYHRHSQSPAVEAFLHDIKRTWSDKINLYLHNCQHFAHHVRRKARQEFKVIE